MHYDRLIGGIVVVFSEGQWGAMLERRRDDCFLDFNLVPIVLSIHFGTHQPMLVFCTVVVVGLSW